MKWVLPEIEAHFNFKVDDRRVLNTGDFAQTTVGKCKKLNRNVVVKTLSRSPYLCYLDDEQERFRVELGVLKTLKHPNIVKMIAFENSEKVRALYLEHHERGTLRKLMQAYPKGMSGNLEVYFPLFRQLMDALEYVHGKGYAHMDVKPENILIGKSGQAVLADFNLSRPHSRNGRTLYYRDLMGDNLYSAPESIIPRIIIDRKGIEAILMDIWACGIVLFEMVVGDIPWHSDWEFESWEEANFDLELYNFDFHSSEFRIREGRDRVSAGQYSDMHEGWRLFNDRGFHFMHNILAVLPEDRLASIADVRKHRWFEYNKSRLSHLDRMPREKPQEDPAPRKLKSSFRKLRMNNYPECFFRKCF